MPIISIVITGFAVLIYLCLLFLVLKANVSRNLKFYFSLYIGGMGVTQSGLFVVTLTKSLHTADYAYRIVGIGVLLFLIAFYPFTSVFTARSIGYTHDSISGPTPDGRNHERSWFLIVVGIFSAAGIAAGLLFPYFSTLDIGRGGFYIPVLYPVVIYLSVPFVIAWVAGLARLIGLYRATSSAFSRNRLLYPLLGSLAVLIGTATNLTPLQDYPVDVVFYVINAGLIAYVVSRYRVIDARTILVKSVVLVGIIGMALLADLGLTISIDTLFTRVGIDAPYWSGVISFVLLLVGFLLLQRTQPVKKWIGQLFPSYADPGIQLEEFSTNLMVVADVASIVDAALVLILTRENASTGCAYLSQSSSAPRIDQMKPTLQLYRDHSGGFRRVGDQDETPSEDSVGVLTPEQIRTVLRVFELTGGPFWLEEVKSRREFGGSEWPEPVELIGLPEICVPLYDQVMISGFFCIDGRSSSRVVDDRMLSLLRTVSGMTSVALSRARVHGRLKTQLEENEVLLKEVHHRVKNNLQIIASYLNLESARIVDPEVKDIFKEMRGRIQSLSLVHETLYGSESFKSIDVRSYVGDLMNVLMDQWAPGGRLGRKIDVRMDIDSVNMTLNTAIPFGLTLNELVTDTCKYAFSASRSVEPGSISITLRTRDGRIHCEIADDGVGMPLGDEDGGSLGMRLVDALVRRQLEGTWEIDRSRGTRHIIEFELME